MQWKGRPQSERIMDLSDPITALIHEEMMNFTLPPQRRYRVLPGIEQQIEAIRNYVPPADISQEQLLPTQHVRRFK